MIAFPSHFVDSGGSKVYDVTKYLDDHPGGAEVMLDVAGQDADEFFEDIGHSKEARMELTKFYIGDFKLDEAALAAMKAAAEKKKQESGPGTAFMVIVLVALIAILFGVYTQMK
jgi:cytochrome b involved in lipid metabolism